MISTSDTLRTAQRQRHFDVKWHHTITSCSRPRALLLLVTNLGQGILSGEPPNLPAGIYREEDAAMLVEDERRRLDVRGAFVHAGVASNRLGRFRGVETMGN